MNIINELWALERELDSLSQKGVPVSKQLGRVRSIILRTKAYEQKTLKRWINPAPNHKEAMAKEKQSRGIAAPNVLESSEPMPKEISVLAVKESSKHNKAN